MQTFETRLKELLDSRASQDYLFMTTYSKPNKSIKECISYIMGEVFEQVKKQRQGNVASAGYADNDILEIAIHYYDEDDIQIKPVSPNVKAATGVSQKSKANMPVKTEPVAEPKKQASKLVELSLFDF